MIIKTIAVAIKKKQKTLMINIKTPSEESATGTVEREMIVAS